ncbi:MAG: AAA family ATPase [Deltaproteobacteria bacterium]|nr:MAG: AAA family ATPase [Deltaproteobacteria bacterium]
MATMIPIDNEYFKTDGERRFYRFLENVAKPDAQYIVWYLPDIKGEEPDFLLFCEKIGLIIFEVKDWALSQIKKAAPNSFTIDIDGKYETRGNPFHQARHYFETLMEKIRADGRLVSKVLEHRGNPKIPIDYGVVFPNINKYEYTEKGLGAVIDTNKIFFWDDLHPDSDICQDKTGKCFLQALKRMFPPKFSFKTTRSDLDYLKHLIFPVVCIEEPKRTPCAYEEQIKHLKIFDNNQEAIARKYHGGHRIIIGPSGTGKTLILVHTAAVLRRYNPNVKSILFVCYNITLVNYIKRLLSRKKVGLGKGRVEVYHFYELCSKILGEEVTYEKESDEYYESVVSKTLSRVKDKEMKYDAILVDEGQDFSDDMFRIITNLLNPDTEYLAIALDEEQNVYDRKLSWKDFGVEARGRAHRVSCVYRNTQEICRFANRFIGKDIGESKTQDLEVFPDFFDFHGPTPEMIQLRSFEEIVSHVVSKMKSMTDKEEYPLSEIAIIYAKKSFEDEDVNFMPKMFEEALNAEGILCTWASEDYHSKTSYDITTDKITISTIHSTKGLDYACVFVVGLDSLKEDGWSKEQLRNLAYVVITRARYQLFIPYIQESELISRLLSCL